MKSDFRILKHFECDFDECFVYDHIKCYVFQKKPEIFDLTFHSPKIHCAKFSNHLDPNNELLKITF